MTEREANLRRALSKCLAELHNFFGLGEDTMEVALEDASTNPDWSPRHTMTTTGARWQNALTLRKRRRRNKMEVIKRTRFDALHSREVVLLVKHDYGYRVEHWMPGGVAPPSDYDTPQEAAARALQLLGISDPVTPQSWPEVAQIGGDGRAPPPRTARS